MSVDAQAILAGQVGAAAKAAGLVVVSSAVGADFSGNPTTRFTLGLADEPAKTQVLELSDKFDFSRAELLAEVGTYLTEAAKRLKNPRPDMYLTLHGLPLSFGKFAWPFHLSTSGADTYLVHGEVRLEDGVESLLHAKVAASMTVTFAEIVAAPEQPFAEGFIYNAVRKTMDQGQLELVKSGNRQPVPVTTRYYSRWQKKFSFNDTTEAQRQEYLAAKVYWLSGVLGGGAPVWLLDPRDAQYLNTTVQELRKTAEALAREGIIHLAGSWTADGEYATPTEALMGHRARYEVEMGEALAFIKPTFNEDMRGGHTNM
ncbi:MAG: hypothetical protein JWM43_4172 [Acidobacteriaceae bacterium]|nr:hypothetical protein [Acidobacteriaceae bacterium]